MESRKCGILCRLINRNGRSPDQHCVLAYIATLSGIHRCLKKKDPYCLAYYLYLFSHMNSTIAGRLFFGGVSITGLYLGSWQVERYYWKKEKIGKEKDAFSTDANKIQFSFDKLDSKAARQKRVVEELEEKHIGRKVLLQGKFIPGHDVLLGLRSIPLSNGRKKAEGMSVNPQGYFVISPFRLENNQNADGCPDSNLNPIVYINRGWIPLNMKQQGYSIPDPNTTKELECVVAAKEKVWLVCL